MSVPTRLQREILGLLRRSVNPMVKIAPSQVDDAGLGIFTTRCIADGVPICLYPGIFTPGIPSGLNDAIYLGRQSLPSGVFPVEANAYILNLTNTGGYLDGLATKDLDENPAACAHLANHSCTENNVEVASFWWHDILQNVPETELYYSIPNRRRCDGSPWFVHESETIFLGDDDTPCAGAAFVATRDIGEGEEIYLDYKLTYPLPMWAEGWYK